MCIPECGNNKICLNGLCQYDSHYGGSNCDIKLCDPTCITNQICKYGKCVCKQEWGGDNYDNKLCDLDCSSTENCSNGVCKPGYVGDNCGTNLREETDKL